MDAAVEAAMRRNEFEHYMDAKIHPRTLFADRQVLSREVERLQKLEGNDDHPENRCERCGGRNLHNWYADSDVWNRVAGTYSVLCPICFCELGVEAGANPTAWRLSMDGDDPEISKLRTALHARLEEGAQDYQELTHARVEVKQLQAIVDKLPRCWRLNDVGELVQDCPVVPEMEVWYWINPEHKNAILVSCKVCSFSQTKLMTDMDGWLKWAYSYSTREAAEAAKPPKARATADT